MRWQDYIKSFFYQQLIMVGVDQILRHMYRNRLLVVMYHGVTKSRFLPHVWTQLPERIFLEQIKWLSKNYIPVSLSDVVEAIVHDRALPARSVLVTFDDGLRNNLSVAYPILKEFSVPAAIFITVDFVGTDSFFWVDELWLAILEAAKHTQKIRLSTPLANRMFMAGQYWYAYQQEVEFLKLVPEEERKEIVTEVTMQNTWDKAQYREDFGLLSWPDIITLDQEGLVEFGAHTATHRILTRMPDEAIEDELFGAKHRLESRLGHDIVTFCYPNGRFGLDYLPEHRILLRDGGYKCAFATNCGLYDVGADHPFSIPRVSIGHDFLSNWNFFKMNVSGLAEIRRKS